MSQVALVTGGGRGLGRAFARALATKGMLVAVASRSADELETTAASLRAGGAQAVAIPTDVTDETAVYNMFQPPKKNSDPLIC